MPVGVLLDRVLNIGDLLVDLIFGRGDTGDRNAVFLQGVSDALDLQLGPASLSLRTSGEAAFSPCGPCPTIEFGSRVARSAMRSTCPRRGDRLN